MRCAARRAITATISRDEWQPGRTQLLDMTRQDSPVHKHKHRQAASSGGCSRVAWREADRGPSRRDWHASQPSRSAPIRLAPWPAAPPFQNTLLLPLRPPSFLIHFRSSCGATPCQLCRPLFINSCAFFLLRQSLHSASSVFWSPASYLSSAVISFNIPITDALTTSH